jgi:hypothetical protein
VRLLFLLLFQLLLSFSIFAQSQVVLKGTVLDSESQEPLSFAYVTINEVALGTVTNGEGEFVLNIPVVHADKSIVFSYLGYVRDIYSISD